MSFLTDKQTLDDLNITGKFKPQSIFNLFNHTQTSGGEKLLEKMFNQPLSNPAAINSRSEVFRFFHERKLSFPFGHQVFQEAEVWLGAGTSGSFLGVAGGLLQKKFLHMAVKDEQYEHLQRGLLAAVEVFSNLRDFLQKINNDFPDTELFKIIKDLFSGPKMQWMQELQNTKPAVMQLAKYDHLVRHVLREDVENILDFIYHLDVYIAVSDTARAQKLQYAKALPKDEYIFRATALRHPALERAVANPLSLHEDQNVLFLTGANMAGKSTFMKSLGIAVYLAHMGFPVAAGEMVFSVRDGLYTSINVPDNLNLGYSHFYAEVLRVRKVAEEVAKGNDLVIIFDELFKGTNVKDAYDATLAVTKEYAAYHNSFFVISTHIIEVGEVLQHDCDNLQFSYLPTIMEGSVPRYTYTLTTGITNDRHGMLIIENERILEMIED
ncbi:MutS-related protein [Pseudobacter ginsenosidimutans]|uniref:MutS-like protein n=1 Tax=Pseudobacter ginsenosidimutans TaxID=661488 RepID=A0A4Q7MWZ2_9BACT|nr:DNA mismatch repair protein [Pseudobacter ginsenosidimutans]QEC40691.1 DNA mismatch repair protein [Pseudobacter ginsenosidimutans]RZS72589.1 MutS-like protein [Pseudobacter ginsenosidimutans]